MQNYSERVQTLLKKRGISNKKDAEAFLNPSYENELHDPFLLMGMDVAVQRILKAFQDNEKIAIYSDFDADGIPGGALLKSFFTKIGLTPVKYGSQKPDHGACFVNYIPHRHTEGYGFHELAVDTLAKEDVSLIITVDVGITSSKTVTHAKKLGVDVIITDHHQPVEGNDFSDAIAVLNPAQKECNYPFEGLCGTGVAYKLVQALIITARNRVSQDSPSSPTSELGESWLTRIADLPEGWEKWLLDLVAISTVADMVPLVGENRALVHWGLQVLRKSPRLGIRALCNKLRINQALLNENDIGFSIGPRINASSRMGESQEAFNLLTTEIPEEAETLAKKLESLNNKRKGAVASITKQVKIKLAQMQEDQKNNGKGDALPNVIVTGDPAWSPALVGLAAGSVADSLGRVVCIWGREGTGLLKGSCRRGTTTHSIVDMFEAASDGLLGFGGHHAAGGFAVSDDDVHTLSDTLNTALNSAKNAKENNKKVAIETDLTLSLQDVHMATYREIAQLAPYGIGNPKPVLRFEDVLITTVKHFGKEQNHLEIWIKDASNYSRKASKFFATSQSFGKEIIEGQTITLLAHLEESAFAGRRSLELRIVDIV